MERDEVEQEVTDLLVIALEFQKRPMAAMLYCRRALECQVHAVYHDQYGHFPDKDGFKDLTTIMKKIDQHLTTQTKELIWSINAQTRSSMHWSNESRGDKGAKTHHVEAVVSTIKSLYQDIFSSELILTGLDIGKNTEKIVKKAINKDLTDLGIEDDLKNIEPPNEEGLENIGMLLDAADAATEIGIKFDPWEEIRLGSAARLSGQLERAEGHYKQALRHFKGDSNRQGESESLGNLKITGIVRGDSEETERLGLESLKISREFENRIGEADSLNCLGNIALTRGDSEEAERLYLESLEISREIGNLYEEGA